MGHTLATGIDQFPQTYKHLALSLPAESSSSISIDPVVEDELISVMPVEMYPLPGPKHPIRIRYVVMSITKLDLSAVLSTVQASVLFRPF